MANDDFEKIMELLEGMDVDQVRRLSDALPDIMRSKQKYYLDRKLDEYGKLCDALLEPETAEFCMKFADLFEKLEASSDFSELKELPGKQEILLKELETLEEELKTEIIRLGVDGSADEAQVYAKAIRRLKPAFLRESAEDHFDDSRTGGPCPVSSDVPNGGIEAHIFGEVEVGNYVEFGTYPQTAEGNDSTPIEWRVLNIKDGNALLLSKYALDCRKLDDKSKRPLLWHSCSLCGWLNGEFLNKAFTAEEQACILPLRTYEQDDKGEIGERYFKVFIPYRLSLRGFFRGPLTEYACKPTPYAVSQGAYLDGNKNGGCSWWVSEPALDKASALAVDPDGRLIVHRSTDAGICVRPQLWVKL